MSVDVEGVVRRVKKSGMINGVRLSIEFISGFEKFNTRPYHCYETWCQGWRITDPEAEITVERENLDDAIKAWVHAVAELEGAL